MRRDTARRIALYHAQLPHLKEKLGVVGMGLVIAALVSVSATFAWITLSRAPEVTAIDTTLSANGALEIALNRGKTPEDADIDESAAFDEALTAANIRWGNLINLNDPSYGIADLTLRPAQLNTAALTTSPFWSAVYGQDGRITELDSRYIYTKYSVDDKIFVATKGNEDYGVRAISSYKAQTTGETASEYEMKYKAVMAAHTEVNQYYMNNVTSAKNVGSLGDALGTYLQSKVNQKGYGYHKDPKIDPANLEMTPNQVQTLLNMFSELQTAMEKEKTALAALANLQQYIYAQQKQYNESYQELTWTDIAAGAETYDIAGNKHKTGENVTSPGEAVALTNLKKFIIDAGAVDSDVAHLQTLVENMKKGEKVYSDEIETQVFHICNGRDVILDGQTVDQALKDPVKTVIKMTGGTLPVVIGSGILRDFEQMAVDPAYRLPYGKDWSARRNRAPVHVDVYTSPGKAWVIDMTACLSTDASGGSHFMADYGKISPELQGGDRVAQDTYGMAVDFWLRSNAEKTYLTLEGAVVKDEETNTVLSFDGVNRVWNTTNDAILTTASTTQGGGSCYTYYADSPEELQRSLRLLGSMKVAFMNTQSGVLLATAVMDTENYYALNGRVTVPLVLSTVDSMTVPGDTPETPDTPGMPETPETPDTPETPAAPGEGETGGETGSETQLRRAITVLYADREENLTAILYLDGANLTNQDVLSSGDIKGQLNLQFGSSEPLSTLGDSDLEMATRYVTAEVDKSEFTYEPNTEMTAQVKIHVTGGQPEKMTGFFVREINARQGTRQLPEMTFAQEKEGDKTIHWTASHTFTTPGTYYLHYVRMDGVDYRVAEPAKVVVRGFTVDSVTWGGMNNEKTYYTVDSSYQESVTAQVSFTDDALRPQRLQAVFTHTDGNSVYAELHSDGNGRTWTGSGSFTTSGTYTLRYLMVDGKAYDINESAKTLHLYLGLSAKVSQGLDSPLTENYDKDHQPKVYKRNLQVWIRDNAGNPLEDLKGAKITYRPGTSASGAITVGLTPGSAGYYTAELGIVNPGRYVFDNIDTGGSGFIRTLTEEAPVFTIIPPDAPKYDENSANSLNVAGVQYALLEQTAYITPIRIQNSGAVHLEAVVYNSVTREYYTLSKGEKLTYAVDNDGTWTLKLPAYTAENGQQRVDGVWQLVCLKLSNCYDGTDKVVLRDAANPIVWLGTTPEAEGYKTKTGLTADKTFDFSPLSTEVISTVQVEMTPGKTALGGKTEPFMTQHKVAGLGIAVTLRDYANRLIPADKLTRATLHISYTANGDADTYGYAVRSAANRTYNIPLQRGEDGRWTVDAAQTGGSGYIWQYVGAYQVTSLELTAPKAVGGTATKKFSPNAPDTTGIPTQYTVTSAPPSLDAVKIIEAKNTAQFGKTPGGTVDGSFLAAYDPGASVKLELMTKDAAGDQYALVPELAVKLELTHQSGTSEANGGYTWKGTTGFEHHTVTLQQSGEENTFTSADRPPLTLLAGSYQVKGTITARGGQTKAIEGLKTVQVYSVSPGLRVRQTEPGGNDIKVNPAGGIWAPAEKDLITTRNYYTTGGDYAVVYMQYIGPKDTEGVYYVSGKTEKDKTTSKNYARYKVPQVKLILSEQGVNYPATLTLPGDNGTEVSLKYTREEETLSADIGRLEIGEDATYKFKASDGKEYPVHHDTQKPVYFGTHTVTTVTTTVNGTTFTRALTKPVTISQQDKPVTAQKLTYTAPTGVTVVVTADGTIPSGGTVKPLMPVKVTLTAKEGYCKPQLSQPKGVYHWTVVSETADRAEYTFNMAFTATNLTPTVSEYPHITFPADSANASIQVTAGGKSQASGVKLKAGTPVTVTVTAKQETGYCLPVLSPSVPVTWETTSSTDFETVYTFTMPTENVTLAAPTTTQMHPIHFDAAAKLQFVGMTQSQTAGGEIALKNGDYAIPGRLITVTAMAVGGTNPQMTVLPATVKPVPNTTSEEATSRTYTFTMPQAAVTLGGTCTPAPVRTLQYSEKGNDFARIARVSVNGSPAEPLTAEGVSSVSVMVGAKVEITLAANDGYYAPRMPSQPVNGLTFAGPTLAAVDKDPAAHYGEATYSFTMPKGSSDTDVLDLTGIAFTATEAPKISVKKNANSGGWYVTYTYIFSIDADGNEKQKSKSYMMNAAAQVFNDVTSAAPGTKLRVVVYSPVYRGYADTVYLTAVGATLGERQQKDYEISYYLTMGTEPVTIEIHPEK